MPWGCHGLSIVIKACGRPHSYFLEQTDQFYPFAGSQYGHGLLHVSRMFLEGSLDQMLALLGELDDPAAPVLLAGCPAKQVPRFQAIDRGSDRTAGELNFLPDDVHRLRSLVHKHFQYGEVGLAEPQRQHASTRVLLDRLEGLPQDQPHTGGRFTARTWNIDWQRKRLHLAPAVGEYYSISRYISQK